MSGAPYVKVDEDLIFNWWQVVNVYRVTKENLTDTTQQSFAEHVTVEPGGVVIVTVKNRHYIPAGDLADRVFAYFAGLGDEIKPPEPHEPGHEQTPEEFAARFKL